MARQLRCDRVTDARDEGVARTTRDACATIHLRVFHATSQMLFRPTARAWAHGGLSERVLEFAFRFVRAIVYGDSESFSRRKSFPSYICTGKQSPTFSFPRRHESVRQIGDDRDTADSPKSLKKVSHRKKARSPSAQWRSIRRRPSQHSPPDVKCVKSKTPENATRVCVASTSTHTQRAYAERAADGNIATIGAHRQCRAPRRATEAGA